MNNNLFFIISSLALILAISLIVFRFFSKRKSTRRFKKYGVLASTLILFVFVGTACSEKEIAEVAEQETVEQSVSVDSGQEDEETEEESSQEEQSAVEEDGESEAVEGGEKQETSTLDNTNTSDMTEAPSKPANIPEGQEDVQVNDNVPYFSDEDISSTEVYHSNGSLDSLGRVTAANAVVGTEIMPAEERGSISHITPTGWNQASYANIESGGWLYNRSHLIGHQMTGNDEPENLMTGTRWFNIRMLEYENFVANYIETTGNHVRYRVTPVFEGDNLLASGAYMEAFSIEDNGEGAMFNIYVPNKQPGVEINYADGLSVGPEGPSEEGEITNYNSDESSDSSSSSNETSTSEVVPESSPAEGDISSIDANGNGTVTIQEAENAGVSMPITSDHWLYKFMRDADGDGMVGE